MQHKPAKTRQAYPTQKSAKQEGLDMLVDQRTDGPGVTRIDPG
jgi:hypothetical protein